MSRLPQVWPCQQGARCLIHCPGCPGVITAITERTDREWPADHPLRGIATVMTGAELEAADGFLICGLQGEPRAPIGPDDAEVLATCHCGAAIIHRASAPKHLKPICWRCWRSGAWS